MITDTFETLLLRIHAYGVETVAHEANAMQQEYQHFAARARRYEVALYTAVQELTALYDETGSNDALTALQIVSRLWAARDDENG